MSVMTNSAPRPILNGVRDESGQVLPVTPEQLPTHLPHVFLFAQEGTTEPQIVSGSSAIASYGRETFNVRSQFATHQTVLATELNGRANQIMVHRVIPEDAEAPATLCLALEVVKADIPVYERNSDGTYRLDQDGDPVETGDTVSGHKMRWLVTKATSGQIGQAAKMAGELTSDGEQSTIYPIMDLQASHQGSYGNLIGMRLTAPTVDSTVPADESLMNEEKAFFYRIQMIRRPSKSAQPNVVETLTGSQSVEFTFKEDVFNPLTENSMTAEDVVLDAYRDMDTLPKTFGPFGGLHVYRSNLEEVQDLILAEELAHQAGFDADDGYKLNLFTTKDIYGNPYHTVKLLGPTEGGVMFGSNTNHYAAGGSDGTLSFEEFDKLVANQMANYGDLETTFLDSAMYPHSVFYDTGFTVDTKLKFFTPLGKRKDVAVVVSTQDVSLPQNTSEEESAIASRLRAAARMYPESELFGTPVCRAIIVGHSGYLVNHQYKKLMPLSLELACAAAEFMGAGNGVWNRDRGFDGSPYNRVRMFKDVNLTYKPSAVYSKDWEAGLVWAQNFDRRSLFFPAVQTVYDDPTSVINSAITMFAIVELEKVAERTWRQLTGNSKLTVDQFIQRSDQLIADAVEGRFDDRFIIRPRTYMTSFDELAGYSWSTDIEIYANNMRTVGTYTIVARRRSDFEE